MKRIIALILIIVVIILTIFFVKYSEYNEQKQKIQNLNKEFLFFENRKVYINDIVSLMNKAIMLNTKNGVKQLPNKQFEENDIDSIKIYLESKSSKSDEIVQVPMEDLMLNDKAGPERVTLAFSDMIFEIKSTEFHEKTGQIKKIVFGQR